MEHSRDRLPTERGRPRKTFLPQMFPLSLRKQNTDSTGSQDSILTQLPLPYHLPAGQEDNYPQHQTYIYSDHHIKKCYPHFGDLVEEEAQRLASGEIAMDHVGEMSKPLDPNSSPYIPTGISEKTMSSDQGVGQKQIVDLPQSPSQVLLHRNSLDVVQDSPSLDAPQDGNPHSVAQGTSYFGPPKGGAIEVSTYNVPPQGINQGHTSSPHGFNQVTTFEGRSIQMDQQSTLNYQQYDNQQTYPATHHQSSYEYSTGLANSQHNDLRAMAQFPGPQDQSNNASRPVIDKSQNRGFADPSYGSFPSYPPSNAMQYIVTGDASFRLDMTAPKNGGSNGTVMRQYAQANSSGTPLVHGYGTANPMDYHSTSYPGDNGLSQLHGNPKYSEINHGTQGGGMQQASQHSAGSFKQGRNAQMMSQTGTSYAQGHNVQAVNGYGSTQQQGSNGYDQMNPYQSTNNFGHSSNNSSSMSSSYGLAGPVLGPQGIVRTDSPAKMFDANSVNHPAQHRRGTVAGGNSVANGPFNYGGTPVPRINYQDLEFKSEPRILGTPILRSRRGQTISNIGAFRLNDQGYDSFPGVGGYHSQEDPSKVRGSPPKMLGNLNGGASAGGRLMQINEHDPFTSIIPQLMPNAMGSGQLVRTQGIPISANEGQYGGVAFHVPFGTKPLSYHLTILTHGGKGKPTIQEALDFHNLPFAENCRLAHPFDEYGVIKISNIPYTVTRGEIMAFLGRNAKIVSEKEYEAIHIIMERVTSKTLDCYVEFVNFDEAVTAVNRFEVNRMGGRGGRLGQRHVEVELSSQAELMKQLFPKAKNVEWIGSRPQIIPRDPNDPYNSGFQGFISSEELVMLVKHVDSPQRSPFAKECPQRPFECLISTLLKFPWYMVDYITIGQRMDLHRAALDLVGFLVERVSNQVDPVNLSPMLLKRVWKAALKCPGFTPIMKDDFVHIAAVDEQTAIEYGLPPYAPWWNPLWTIGPKPGVENDVLLWYISIIRGATESKEELTLAEQAARGSGASGQKLFGELQNLIEYGPGLKNKTLSEVAKCEWTAIETVLRMALTSSLQQGQAL